MKRRALLALLPLPWLPKLERRVTDEMMAEACRKVWAVPPGPDTVDVLLPVGIAPDSAWREWDAFIRRGRLPRCSG